MNLNPLKTLISTAESELEEMAKLDRIEKEAQAAIDKVLEDGKIEDSREQTKSSRGTGVVRRGDRRGSPQLRRLAACGVFRRSPVPAVLPRPRWVNGRLRSVVCRPSPDAQRSPIQQARRNSADRRQRSW